MDLSRPSRQPSRRVSSRSLLIVAALGAIDAILTVALTPVTTSIALASPVGYALVGGVHLVLPAAAGLLLRSWTALPLTSFVTAALAFPFSVLGILLFPALILPSLAIGLTIRATGCRWASRGRWVLAALSGAVTSYLISLPVISPDLFSTSLLLAVLTARVVSTGAAAAIAHALVAALTTAGIRPRG
ncbi:hypothetical protein [Microbacterium sp. MPKO10]|uniref:hypothetical protein n=1 Tax=Microbacterium sp. MPKO10 TaxID=2989818 RepID=UPI00223602D1|nr:hypothetical protein [Microbacterium sp. MPKO10]MCW4458962.1 hypothetical protein [Microbacterium sp. MPKO10]